MFKELNILLFYTFSIYFVGFVSYLTFFRKIFKKQNFFINIGISWGLGNLFFIAVLSFLAFTNNLKFVNLNNLIFADIFFLIILIASLIKNKLSITKVFFKNLILLLFFILFFLPLIKDSVYSYLIGWDAIAIWMLKAKAFFYSNGIWDTPLFLRTDAISYSHKEYPLGLPLMAAGYYKLIGSVNDQLIQFYFLNFYLNIVLVFFGFVRVFLKEISLISSIIITLTLLILPNITIYAHNGYADIPLSFVFTLIFVLFLSFFQAKDEDFKFDHLKLILPISALATALKNEGYALFIIVNLITWISMLKSFLNLRKTFSVILILLVSIFPLVSWEYIRNVLGIHSYLEGVRIFPNIVSRIKIILYVYIDEFINVNKYSLASVPFILLFILQAIVFLINKKIKSLIPFVLILLQLGVYTLVYLITPVNLEWQLRSSFERLWIHVLPAFYMAVLYQMKDFLKSFFAEGVNHK